MVIQYSPYLRYSDLGTGLVVRFSLRVREVPSSTPTMAVLDHLSLKKYEDDGCIQ